VYVLYQALTSGTVGNYTDALADTALWSDMTCAIYNAIAADGHVTDANYGTVLANVRAVTYVHPDVVAAIGDYVQALGARGMEQAQLVGALNAADCSGCNVWCHRFDFATDQQGWSIVTGGRYYPGFGWQSTANGNQLPLDIQSTVFSAPVHVISIELVGGLGPATQGQYERQIIETTTGTVYNYSLASSTVPVVVPIGAAMTGIRVVAYSDQPTESFFTSILIHGSGPNPYGSSNC